MRLSGHVLANLRDPSTTILPALSWDLDQSTSLSLGGVLGLGEKPTFPGAIPLLGSEYGTYGKLGYAQISVYF